MPCYFYLIGIENYYTFGAKAGCFDFAADPTAIQHPIVAYNKVMFSVTAAKP